MPVCSALPMTNQALHKIPLIRDRPSRCTHYGSHGICKACMNACSALGYALTQKGIYKTLTRKGPKTRRLCDPSERSDARQQPGMAFD